MYSVELTNAQVAQNVAAVQALMSARGVPARTDGNHTGNILTCEGTSIDNYGSPGWCAGMSLNFSPQILVTSDPGQTYGNGTTSGILSYTSYRDGPLVNPLANRNVITLGAPTNDFNVFPIAAIEGYYSSTVAAVRAEGYTQVYCGYMLSRTGTASGTGGTYDAAHDAWNAWLQANYSSIGCTNVIPWDSRLTADGAWNNLDPAACGGSACFSGDGVHPSQAGFATMSLLAAPIINSSAPIAVSVVGSTQTQIVIQYTAPSSAACTVSATDNNNGPTVQDLNASLFTNANQDLSRTVAGGFFWPTLVSGLRRTQSVITGLMIRSRSTRTGSRTRPRYRQIPTTPSPLHVTAERIPEQSTHKPKMFPTALITRNCRFPIQLRLLME